MSRDLKLAPRRRGRLLLDRTFRGRRERGRSVSGRIGRSGFAAGSPDGAGFAAGSPDGAGSYKFTLDEACAVESLSAIDFSHRRRDEKTLVDSQDRGVFKKIVASGGRRSVK
jgi:hypothetical protein